MKKLDINSTVKLLDGYEIPLLGLGTWQASNSGDCYRAVRFALDQGYRHIDTARIYGNEESVGRAIRESGIPRKDIFVTSKLFLFYGRNSGVLFNDSFSRLGLDYLDLLLVHFPFPGIVVSNWRKLEKIYSSGTVRSLGVSNHSIKQVNKVIEIAKVKPVLNQIKCSPYNYDRSMQNFLESKGMFLEAYSPLTRGKKLNDALLLELAAKYNKSTAQILIRWCLQKGIIVIPKSVHKNRIKENADVYDFEILDEDIVKLDGLSNK